MAPVHIHGGGAREIFPGAAKLAAMADIDVHTREYGEGLSWHCRPEGL